MTWARCSHRCGSRRGSGSPADLRLAPQACGRSVKAVPRPRPDPRTFRRYTITPGWPVMIEVHCADGEVALVHGRIDRVPWPAGENAQRVVVVDAVARPLPVEVRSMA